MKYESLYIKKKKSCSTFLFLFTFHKLNCKSFLLAWLVGFIDLHRGHATVEIYDRHAVLHRFSYKRSSAEIPPTAIETRVRSITFRVGILLSSNLIINQIKLSSTFFKSFTEIYYYIK